MPDEDERRPGQEPATRKAGAERAADAPPGSDRGPDSAVPYAAVAEFAAARVRPGYDTVSIGEDGHTRRVSTGPRMGTGEPPRGVTAARSVGSVAGVPELVTAIREEIGARGPMTFARFMELALYHHEHGYYATAAERGTRSGDFLTAPETHPIFGAAVAHQLEEMWERLGRPPRFTLVDHGAGTGALGSAIIERLRAVDSPLLHAFRYRPVEVNAARRSFVDRRLAAEGLDGWLDGSAETAPVIGAVVGNELLDALPVHRVVGRDGGLRELFVAWRDGTLVEHEGPPSTPELEDHLHRAGVTLADGQRAEVRLGVGPWIRDAAAELERGYLLIIDYGFTAAELYGRRRRAGTLRAFRAHHANADPFAAVGRQDLTAHVDLSDVVAAGGSAGLDLLGWTSQAEFLVGLGLGDLLTGVQAGGRGGWAEYVAARAAATRLIDPGAMGGFGVLVFGRGVPLDPPLRGLTFRLPPGAR